MGASGSAGLEVDDARLAEEFELGLSLGEEGCSPVARRRSLCREDSNMVCAEYSQPLVDPDDDPYDPRKPEYMQAAGAEEAALATRCLLRQQIGHLEHFLLAKSEEPMESSESAASAEEAHDRPAILGHYRACLVDLRQAAASEAAGALGRRSSSLRCRVRLQDTRREVDDGCVVDHSRSRRCVRHVDRNDTDEYCTVGHSRSRHHARPCGRNPLHCHISHTRSVTSSSS